MTDQTPRKAKAVVHLTPEERAATGKAARAEVPRSSHGEWEPRAPTAAMWSSCSRSRPPPAYPSGSGSLRADARVAVHVLSWCGVPDGGRSGRIARTGLQVQLCGDAHLSNFGVYAAPDRTAGLQRQRLRRDLARPVRVGPQASRGQLRGRRPGSGLRRKATAGDQCRRGPLVPEAMEELRRDGQPRALVFAHPRRRVLSRRSRHQRVRKQVKRFERNVAKARSKDSLKAFAKLTERRRRRTADRRASLR